MDRDKQKKINRNNRKRGSAFEKRVASILDMDLVPYSGSNARFGYGDIRDSLWLGECKNITADVNNRVTILHSWLDKNIKRAEDIGHIPFLAFVANGRPSKYIILDESTFYMMNALIHDRITLPKASKKSVNLIISLDVISKINNKSYNFV